MADEGRLGYLAVQASTDALTFVGGLLTTDSELRPLDFRCTTTVRPTPLQKVLYGEILQQHLFVDLLGLTLVRAADPQPDLILFQDSALLYLQRKLDSMAALWAAVEPGAAGSPTDAIHPPIDTQHLTITGFSGGTIGIFVYPGYGERIAQVKTLLESVAMHFDLLEPFGRMPRLLAQALQPPKTSDAA
jgi:hypothetical protein